MEEHDYNLLGAFDLVKQSNDTQLKQELLTHLPHELKPYFVTPKGIVRVEQEFGDFKIKVLKGIEGSVRIEIWQLKEVFISADFLLGKLVMEKTWRKGLLPVQRSRNMIISERNSVRIVSWTREVTETKTKYWIGQIKGFFQDAVDAMKIYHAL